MFFTSIDVIGQITQITFIMMNNVCRLSINKLISQTANNHKKTCLNHSNNHALFVVVIHKMCHLLLGCGSAILVVCSYGCVLGGENLEANDVTKKEAPRMHLCWVGARCVWHLVTGSGELWYKDCWQQLLLALRPVIGYHVTLMVLFNTDVVREEGFIQPAAPDTIIICL